MNKKHLILLSLAFILAVSVLFSLCVGGSKLGITEVFTALLNGSSADTTSTIVWKIRVPRVLLGVFVGMGLAAVGCVFQGLLRNPLADPYTLGISGGAAFGATLAVITGIAAFTAFSVPICAFLGSLACFYAVYMIASRKSFSINSLILTGVIFGFIFSSAVLLMLALASPDKIHASIIWLTGDLSSAGRDLTLIVPAIVLVGTAVLMIFSRELNVLVLGEEKALTLGIETEKTKKIIFVTASLITGACVSASGIIGFVGLIIPHLMRKITGPDHRYLIPASALGGAAFLPLCDSFSRTIIAPVELPVGVVTGLAGGIFFLVFLLRSEKI
ncbi:MAG: iron ABC transporter permease [Elusimicrobiota bacterium]